jgi:hypothetical protein
LTSERAAQAPVVWHHRQRSGGVDVFRAGTARGGSLLVAEWPGLGRLTCARDGTRGRFVAERGADAAGVAKLRAGAVQAILGDVRGDLGVHGAAVEVGGRAVLILGKSGAGKSTTAGELCVRHGARLLADDIALLAFEEGRVGVRPGERHHSLTRGSMRFIGLAPGATARTRGGKAMLRATRPARAVVPLDLIVALRPDGRRSAPTLRVLRGVHAALAVMTSVVRFDRRTARRGHLDQVVGLCEGCRVVEVVRPARASAASRVGPLLLSELLSTEKGVAPHG